MMASEAQSNPYVIVCVWLALAWAGTLAWVAAGLPYSDAAGALFGVGALFTVVQIVLTYVQISGLIGTSIFVMSAILGPVLIGASAALGVSGAF